MDRKIDSISMLEFCEKYCNFNKDDLKKIAIIQEAINGGLDFKFIYPRKNISIDINSVLAKKFKKLW